MVAPGPVAPRTDTTVTVQMSPQVEAAWGQMRRRVDVLRSHTGRVATVAGAAAAAAVVAVPGVLPAALLGTVAVTAAGAGLLRLQMPRAGHQKATATVLYTVPGGSLSALMVGEQVANASEWGGTLPLQLLAVAVWTAGTWLLRPARVARRMATAPPPPAPPAVPVEYIDTHPAARWWAEHAAREGGPAPGTVLEGIERTGERGMRAIIRATAPGEPVPDISIRRLSALMDIPEDQIAISPVPGRGAGVRRLTVGTADQAVDADPATVWAERIAPVAMPGAVLTGIRVGTPRGTADTGVSMIKEES